MPKGKGSTYWNLTGAYDNSSVLSQSDDKDPTCLLATILTKIELMHVTMLIVVTRNALIVVKRNVFMIDTRNASMNCASVLQSKQVLCTQYTTRLVCAWLFPQGPSVTTMATYWKRKSHFWSTPPSQGFDLSAGRWQYASATPLAHICRLGHGIHLFRAVVRPFNQQPCHSPSVQRLKAKHANRRHAQDPRKFCYHHSADLDLS